MAAVGAVLGAAFALFFERKELNEWIARGMVLGGALGALIAVWRAVLSGA
jgi:hypothetical protein